MRPAIGLGRALAVAAAVMVVSMMWTFGASKVPARGLKCVRAWCAPRSPGLAVLLVLDSSNDALSVAALARAMGMPAPVAQQWLGTLTSLGLVRVDRDLAMWAITPTGRRVLDEHLGVLSQCLTQGARSADHQLVTAICHKLEGVMIGPLAGIVAMIPMLLVFCAGLAIVVARRPVVRIGHNNHARLVAIHRHTVRWRGLGLAAGLLAALGCAMLAGTALGRFVGWHPPPWALD